MTKQGHRTARPTPTRARGVCADRYWNAIVGNSGQESESGWRKDKWGLSWQISSIVLIQAVIDPNPAVAKRAFDAMMEMRKIDIGAIEEAIRGGDAGEPFAAGQRP